LGFRIRIWALRFGFGFVLEFEVVPGNALGACTKLSMITATLMYCVYFSDDATPVRSCMAMHGFGAVPRPPQAPPCDGYATILTSGLSREQQLILVFEKLILTNIIIVSQ